MSPNENALAGVDYAKMKGFKNLMKEVCQQTQYLPAKKGVNIVPAKHAAFCEFHGTGFHAWLTTKEGLGNKAWISMLLNHLGLRDPKGFFHFGGIGIDTFLMGANDNAAHGGDPVLYMDEVSCGSDDFFQSPMAIALAGSFMQACRMASCALGQGESPAYRYLMNAEPPVEYAPSLSVCVVGLLNPASRFISGDRVAPGDILIGFPSSGLHANGISPIIRRVMQLPDGFLTKLNGWTVGQEALIPTRSYVGLVQALICAGIDIHGFLPVTGDGIGKLGVDKRHHFVVDNWVENIPPLFSFMREMGMTRRDLAETFNCGIGYIAMVPPNEVDDVMRVGQQTQIDGETDNYDPIVIGHVEEGDPGTDFVPWGLHLPPPGEE